MIPQRIAVQGFLCYRDEQEIGFDTAALWMLAGLNGSGKSAVFDGVTYALFGGHRGGTSGAEELINKSSDRAMIEFDFLLEGKAYRARRTLKRKPKGGTTPTQQIYRREGGQWQPVPDTVNKRDFDRWVLENVGLTYETFTSSVLLMQGKAEKLLDAGPKGRFEVLAGIVDLDRYQRLHERADEKRKQLKERVEALQFQLHEAAEVTAAELMTAEDRASGLEDAVQQGHEQLDRLQRLVVQAEQWQQTEGRLTQARRQLSDGQKLLADATSIEAAMARLTELRNVLPPLHSVRQLHQRLIEARRLAASLADEQRTLAAKLGQLTTQLAECRSEQQRLQESTATQQHREQEIAARLRELGSLLASVKLCESQRIDLKRVEDELARLPANAAASLQIAQQERERLRSVALALPLLSHFHTARQALALAIQQGQSAALGQAEIKANGEAVARQDAALEQEVATATQRRQAAEARATETLTLFNQASAQLKQLDELHGAKICRHCGQELTPEHLEVERTRRGKAKAQAESDHRRADEQRALAVEAQDALQKQKDEVEKRLTKLRDQFKDLRRKQREAGEAIERHEQECERIAGETAGTFRALLRADGDWRNCAYPSADDLDALQREAAGAAANQQRVQQAELAWQQVQKLQTQREVIQRALSTLEQQLPADVESLRKRLADLEADDAAVKTALKTARADWQTAQDTITRLDREQTVIREHLNDLSQRWGAEEARREEGEKALQQARSGLPEVWQSRAETAAAPDLKQWEAEQRTLEQDGIERRAAALDQVRAGLDALERRVAELQEEADRVPEDARGDPELVKQRRLAARQDQTTRENHLLQARQDCLQLTERRQRRQTLQQQLADLDREHNHHRLLAELLGRNRLQLHLVRKAERGIVDHANAVLDRLSGGQLYLRLRGDTDSEAGADQALQLETFNRCTGEAPIGVAFLSGSQRFRVAVSLALGIGQYASRQHRPIESVIIDEGFGCLDRQGRHVMIQELQNLRGQLRCILLVSHQEEFADAFADGYRFELVDGRTQVTRFPH